jgi:hypothetical protein
MPFKKMYEEIICKQRIKKSHYSIWNQNVTTSKFHNIKNKKLDNFFCQIVAGNKKLIKKL